MECFGRAGYAEPVRGKKVVLLNVHFRSLQGPGVVMHLATVKGLIWRLGVQAVALREPVLECPGLGVVGWRGWAVAGFKRCR